VNLDWWYRTRLYRWWLHRQIRKRRDPDCADDWCRGKEAKHAHCYRCSAVTCSRGQWIDPHTLKRRIVALCDECRTWSPSRTQHELRAARVRHDWKQVTDPVKTHAIVPEVMPDYLGRARSAIRAFEASNASTATVPDITASVVQETIQRLGLDDEIYAEQRAHTTVLRRVEATA
jgi:hypothetical protein